MVYFNRQIKKQLQSNAKQFKVIVLTGPRQSGKTTLVRKIFKKYMYFNLEDFDTFAKITEDIKSIINKDNLPFVIDEAQRVPGVLNQIQVLVDSISQHGQVVVTGSSNILLMQQVTQSLAGRAAISHLLPLNLFELKQNKLFVDTGDIWKIILHGGFPRIYAEQIKREVFFKNYISTYIEKDVRNTLKITSYSDFVRLIYLLASRIGQLVDYTDISNGLDVSRVTVKQWINLLEVGFNVYRLPAYFRNFGKRIIKTPKLYFVDTGVLAFLLGIKNKTQLIQSVFKGSIFENFVIMDYIKTAYALDKSPQAYFYRDKEGTEIDLLIDMGTSIHAIEIKSSQTFSTKHFKGLDAIKRFIPGVKTYLVIQSQRTTKAPEVFKGHEIWSVNQIDRLWLKILQ